MPLYKFGENDIFRGTIEAHPKYTLTLYHNLSYINSAVHAANVGSGKISLYDMNIDRPTSGALGSKTNTGLIKAIVDKGENFQNVSFVDVKTSSDYDTADNFTSSYPLTSSILRELVIAEKSSGDIVGVDIRSGVTTINTVRKLIALKNTYDHYRPASNYFDFDTYLLASGGMPPFLSDAKFKPTSHWVYYNKKGVVTYNSAILDTNLATALTESVPKSDYINLITIPSIFYGSGIKRGSVDLQFYYSGSLLARAQDKNQNGELFETTGTEANNVIGTVLYNEGIIVITASYVIQSENRTEDLKDGYMSPDSGTFPEDYSEGSNGDDRHATLSASWIDYPRWAHFGAYQSFISSSTDAASSSYAPASSSYTLEFQGTTHTPVLTMMAHAQKNDLIWSNNPTYVDRTRLTGNYVENFIHQTGAYGYKEHTQIAIKNTISSSHKHYSESFKPQTFISKIGIYDENNDLIAIAKLATPVKKTSEQDYTFKLKLDL